MKEGLTITNTIVFYFSKTGTTKNLATCATSDMTGYSRAQSFIERTVKDNGYHLNLLTGAVLNSHRAMINWLNGLNFLKKAA